MSDRVEHLRALLDRFDRAGLHFRESHRQALLGLREVIVVVEELAAEYGEQVPLLRTILGVLLVARGALDLWVSRIPPLEDDVRTLELKIEGMGILRDLLTAELMRLGEGPEQAARREGLLTVLGVIDQEIERLATEIAERQRGPRPEPEPPASEWIEVET